MFKRNIIIASAFFFIAVSECRAAGPSPHKVCVRDYCFNVELAVTPEERQRGLSFRRELSWDDGMLFIFDEEDTHAFWMKDMFMPLDIIWINKDKEVVYISRNLKPCTRRSCLVIEPSRKAMYVLEVNAGVADHIGLTVGDKFSFDI